MKSPFFSSKWDIPPEVEEFDEDVYELVSAVRRGESLHSFGFIPGPNAEMLRKEYSPTAYKLGEKTRLLDEVVDAEKIKQARLSFIQSAKEQIESAAAASLEAKVLRKAFREKGKSKSRNFLEELRSIVGTAPKRIGRECSHGGQWGVVDGGYKWLCFNVTFHGFVCEEA